MDIELDSDTQEIKLFNMNINAYIIRVAIDDLNVLINGLTFLLIQHEQIDTPMQDDIHDPTILTGISGNDNTAPIFSSLVL